MQPFAINAAAPRFAIVEMFGGDNNLSPEIAIDLEEMRQGLPADALVIALTDHHDSEAKVMTVSGGQISENEQWGEIDTGDPVVLERFLSRALVSVPLATPIAIGFWDHGSGVFDENDPAAPGGARGLAPRGGRRRRLFWGKGAEGQAARAMLNDHTNGGLLTTLEAGKLLGRSIAASGRSKVAMIYSDTCLNGMVEVLAEFDAFASCVVGSPELEPFDGWGYSAWLEALGSGAVDGNRFATTAVDAYRQTYDAQTGLYPCTLAGFSPSDAILAAFAALVREADLLGRPGFADLDAARFGCQSFASKDSYDLIDFAVQLQANARVQSLRDAAAGLAQAVITARIGNCALGADVVASGGLAFWFPSSRTEWLLTSATYADLRFERLTGWARYLGKQF